MSSKFPRTGHAFGPGGRGAFSFSAGVRRCFNAKAATQPSATLTGVKCSILAENEQVVEQKIDEVLLVDDEGPSLR